MKPVFQIPKKPLNSPLQSQIIRIFHMNRHIYLYNKRNNKTTNPNLTFMQYKTTTSLSYQLKYPYYVNKLVHCYLQTYLNSAPLCNYVTFVWQIKLCIFVWLSIIDWQWKTLLWYQKNCTREFINRWYSFPKWLQQ